VIVRELADAIVPRDLLRDGFVPLRGVHQQTVLVEFDFQPFLYLGHARLLSGFPEDEVSFEFIMRPIPERRADTDTTGVGFSDWCPPNG
jgi:hypothetical protein